MNRKQFIQGLGAGIVIPVLSQTYAQTAEVQPPTTDINAIVTGLKQGGYVIVFRHGASNKNQSDTALTFSDITKQRLLSDKGRKECKQVGESFRKLGIPLGKIYTSMFNRAVETGKLIGGRDEVTATLDVTDSGSLATTEEHDRRVQVLRTMAATMPAQGKNTLIVTQKPNIIDAFGKEWSEVKEGEALIFNIDPANKSTLVAHLQSSEWIAAAAST
jgi:phosphohistidine phosphatase SixA